MCSSMTGRLSVTLSVLLALTQSCMPHNVPLVTLDCPAAVAKSPAEPLVAPPMTAEPVVSDGPRAAPLPRMNTVQIHTGPVRTFQAFTLVINNRVVAVVPADADSTKVSDAWAKLDPERIKTIAVYETPRAQQCYPAAVGTLIVATQR